MFGSQFVAIIEPGQGDKLVNGMVMHRDYLLRGSYHGNKFIYIHNCHGVRWQVQLRQMGQNKVAVIGPAWSDFVHKSFRQDVRLLHFVEEGHDTFYVATYNKYGLENHGYKQTSLMFWRCLTRVTKKSPLIQNLPLELEKRVYPPSGSQTVDLVLNHRKYKVLVGHASPDRNILELYFYGEEWMNMMQELNSQTGHWFAFTLLRRGVFNLTVFNQWGGAVTASETHSSYVLRNAFFHLGRNPAEYNVQRMGWFCNWRGHASHAREDRAFYKKLTLDTLKEGRIVIPLHIVKTFNLFGYASAIVTNINTQYKFELRWGVRSNSLELYSFSPMMGKMKEMTTRFMADQWTRFYLTEGTSLKEGVICLDVC